MTWEEQTRARLGVAQPQTATIIPANLIRPGVNPNIHAPQGSSGVEGSVYNPTIITWPDGASTDFLNPLYPYPSETPIQSNAPYFPPNAAYPGSLYGASFPDVQALIRKQLKCAGFNFVCPALTVFTRPIKLSGTAKILMGFKIGNDLAINNIATTMSLMVNNEIIVDNVSVYFFSNQITINAGQINYIPLPRPLSGTDQIFLIVNSLDVGAVTYEVNFYFL